MEHLLRDSWNTNLYVTAGPDFKKAFLVEESSKAHIQRISALMKSNYDWSCLAMISLLSADADFIGSWAESCPCHVQPPEDADLKVKRQAKRELNACPFRCCRAPELASGHGLKHLCQQLLVHKKSFAEYVSRAPESNRAELNASWETACSKLFGYPAACSK